MNIIKKLETGILMSFPKIKIILSMSLIPFHISRIMVILSTYPIIYLLIERTKLALFLQKLCHSTLHLVEFILWNPTGNFISTMYSRLITSKVQERCGAISSPFIRSNSSKSIFQNKFRCFKISPFAFSCASYDIFIKSFNSSYPPSCNLFFL